MTEFYVHIGLHKTGTTSIQKTFYRGRKLLDRKHGVFYLPLCPNHGPAFYSHCSDKPHKLRRNILAGLNGKKEAREHAKGVMENISGLLERNKNKKVVISGERLSSLKIAGVHKFKEYISQYCQQPRFIVYVRDPVGWTTSWLQQAIQGRHTLEDFKESPPVPQLSERIGPYIECFGKERVDIRCFNEAVNNEFGLIGDFLEALGKSPEIAKQLKVVHSNESLCAEAVMMMNEVRTQYSRAKRTQLTTEELQFKANNLFKSIPGSKFVLPMEMRDRIIELSAPETKWLSEQMGRNPFENIAPTKVDVAPMWGEATVKKVGLKLFELFKERRILKAEVAYLQAQKATTEGKPDVAVKFVKKALKADAGHKQAKLLRGRLEGDTSSKIENGKKARKKRKRRADS